MVDINKIFDLHNKVEEIERRKQSLERLDKSSLSVFDQQRNALNELMLESNRGLHNPVQNLQNHLQDLHNPAKQFRNHFEEINKSFKFLDDLRFAEKSIHQSVLENLSGFQNSSIQNSRKLIEETFQPFVRNSLISDQIKSSFEQVRESILKPYHFQNSDLLKSFEQITKATALSSFETLSKTILEKENLLGSRDFLMQISNSLLSYGKFTNSTLAKLNFDADKSIASALKGSLTLASEQMLRSTSLTQSFAENLDVVNFDKSNLFFDKEFPKENRYRVQKRELLRYDDIEEDEPY